MDKKCGYLIYNVLFCLQLTRVGQSNQHVLEPEGGGCLQLHDIQATSNG